MVRDAEARFADDSQWVPQTAAYRRLQEERAAAAEELVRVHAEKAALEAALRREQEALRVRHAEFNQLHRAASLQEVRWPGTPALHAGLCRLRSRHTALPLALSPAGGCSCRWFCGVYLMPHAAATTSARGERLCALVQGGRG